MRIVFMYSSLSLKDQSRTGYIRAVLDVTYVCIGNRTSVLVRCTKIIIRSSIVSSFQYLSTFRSEPNSSAENQCDFRNQTADHFVHCYQPKLKEIEDWSVPNVPSAKMTKVKLWATLVSRLIWDLVDILAQEWSSRAEYRGWEFCSWVLEG
jgi:hypothetical protein